MNRFACCVISLLGGHAIHLFADLVSRDLEPVQRAAMLLMLLAYVGVIGWAIRFLKIPGNPPCSS